ncbi:MAG: ADP-glyceromanno-heptose 6-epimerase [Candidatus Omnitrophica bacterium]|nr:ADP-glyceromanno-heptose 6-epimerase [Candidatus Omnitrophota bacterium]
MIILTGGAGFIGSAFLWKLNQMGITDILVVDALGETDKWKNLRAKRFSDYIQKMDFLELVNENKLPKPEAVVHMGACSSTTLTDANYFIKNNYEYTKTLAAWAMKHKAPFLYASSAATYGDGAQGYSDDHKGIPALEPLNMYGYSKQLFDLWALHNGCIKKITGIKFFNVFGPNEYHKGEMMSVICKQFRLVKNDGVIKLFRSYRPDYKDGEQKRDFIYIKDTIEVMYWFFTHPGKTGLFNLGTGRARSWNDIAAAMFSSLGKKPRIEYIEMPDYLKPKYQYFTQADMDKLRKAGCRHTFQSLEDSIRDYTKYLTDGTYL